MSTQSDKLAELVSWLPRHLQSDPNVQMQQNSIAGEVVRIDAAWKDLLDQFFVLTATWGLSMWEQNVGLDVAPVGFTDEQRRNLIMAKLQTRNVSSGAAFNAALATITPSFTLQMHYATGQLDIDIIYNPDAYTEEHLDTIVSEMIPAHLNPNITYTSFIVGASTSGDHL